MQRLGAVLSTSARGEMHTNVVRTIAESLSLSFVALRRKRAETFDEVAQFGTMPDDGVLPAPLVYQNQVVGQLLLPLASDSELPERLKQAINYVATTTLLLPEEAIPVRETP
jgi:hypothetical protein